MEPKKTHLLTWFCGIAVACILTGATVALQTPTGGSGGAPAPAGAPALAGAQAPASPSYTIPINVNRVLIPVVVRDKSGRVIEGLEQKDFTVLDNGKPREVTGFLMEQTQPSGNAAAPSTMAPGKAAAASTTTSGNAAAPAPVQPKGARYILLLFDDLHFSLGSMAAAKKGAADLLATLPLDRDYVAVAALSGNANSGFTHDRALLQSTLSKLHISTLTRQYVTDCPKMDYYEADQIDQKQDPGALAVALQQLANCCGGCANESYAKGIAHSVAGLGRMDVLNTFSRIETFAKTMAPLPGQRLVLLASPGFFTDTPEDRGVEAQTIEAAARAGVIISALDARGLSTTSATAAQEGPNDPQLEVDRTQLRTGSALESREVMMNLAAGTGGSYFQAENRTSRGFEQLIQVPDSLYLLEISLDGVKRDGSYHKLAVKVDRGGANVQARNGYPAPNDKASKAKEKTKKKK